VVLRYSKKKVKFRVDFEEDVLERS